MTDTGNEAASSPPEAPISDRDRRKAAIEGIEAEFGDDGVIELTILPAPTSKLPWPSTLFRAYTPI